MHHSAHNNVTACRMRLHMAGAGYGSLPLLRHFGHMPAPYAYGGTIRLGVRPSMADSDCKATGFGVQGFQASINAGVPIDLGPLQGTVSRRPPVQPIGIVFGIYPQIRLDLAGLLAGQSLTQADAQSGVCRDFPASGCGAHHRCAVRAAEPDRYAMSHLKVAAAGKSLPAVAGVRARHGFLSRST